LRSIHALRKDKFGREYGTQQEIADFIATVKDFTPEKAVRAVQLMIDKGILTLMDQERGLYVCMDEDKPKPAPKPKAEILPPEKPRFSKGLQIDLEDCIADAKHRELPSHLRPQPESFSLDHLIALKCETAGIGVGEANRAIQREIADGTLVIAGNGRYSFKTDTRTH
jgi:hypothetical protein